MSRYLAGLLIAVLFIGCSTHTDTPVKSHVKAFYEEDEYIMYALSAEQYREYDAASSIYMTLYKRSDKSEYLYRSLHRGGAGVNSQKGGKMQFSMSAI